MPFARPTLADLVTRIRSDFRGRLGLEGQLLRRTMTDVLAAVWAGGAHLMHGHLEWIASQLRATTAEREYLLEDAAIWGITPTAATFATGQATATGTNGTVIPLNTVLVHSSGQRYRTTAAATIASELATLSLEALVAGDEGNLDAGELVTFESPIAGVNSAATVAGAGLAGGNDVEGTEEVRDRLLLRLREPPTGGSDQDWVGWTLSVAGITRAWVYRHESGLGTLTVRFMKGENGDVFPVAADVTAVQSKLDAERPTTATPTAAAPTALNVNFTIAVVPNTTAVKNAVTAELKDLFDREGEPGDGAGRGTIFLSAIRTAIGVAEGLTNYTLTVPAADVVPALGQKPVVGIVTYV